MKEILALNKVSPLVNDVIKGKFVLKTDASEAPEGIIVRSFDMHSYEPAESVLCVGRAGAGVNNIPIDKYAEKGIVVFNTPGANANAVAELVLASLFLSGRKIIAGVNWAQGLKTDVAASVEKGKGAFVGGEIIGKTLAVYGLGAIGKLVACAAAAIGMKVIGYDPFLSEDKIWNLGRCGVLVGKSIEDMISKCDFLTLHAPYNESTKHFINKERLATMKDGVNIINCARGELVSNADIKEAVASGKVNRYVTDFPVEELLGIENIITIPHLGASTPEAEDNCAVMAGQQMVDFIENGTITNSVNFPAVSLAKSGKARLVILCGGDCCDEKLLEKVGKVGKITGYECKKGKNTAALFDFAEKLDEKALETVSKLGCVKARVIQ